jgi:signal transduction histidine kinase/ligand-binding sensor domain-containing protein/DNA-binding response OmpR family regulator
MPYLRPLILTIVPLCWLLSTRAQPATLRFDHLGTESGLSQSNITCILQDSRGFMWFGTRDGLNRYDGYEFTVYKNNLGDPKSLSNNFITDLTEDRNGDLWIATWGGGINRYDRTKDRFIHYSTNPTTKFINAVIEDHRGQIWIGTNGGGVDVFDPSTGKTHTYVHDPNDPASISANDVKTICEDYHHRIWLGTTGGGLDVYDQEQAAFPTFTTFRHNPTDPTSLAADAIQKILEDRQHRLWIATQGGGLDELMGSASAQASHPAATANFRHYPHDPNNPHSLSSNVLMSLATDEDGNLWIGTDNGGLNILNPNTGRFGIYLKDEVDINSLNNNSVHSLYRDPQGDMWVGTYSGGINLYSKAGTQFKRYKHTSNPTSLANDFVLTIMEDRRHDIWIGTDGGGLDRLNRSTGVFTHYRHDPQNPGHTINGNFVLAVQEDHAQNLWLGMWGDGLAVLDKDRNLLRQYRHDPANPGSLNSNNVYAVQEDHDNNIWVGTYGAGLERFDEHTHSFIHYRHDPNNPASLGSDRVHALLVDSKNDLWVGTFDGGVDKLDRKTNTFTHFIHKNTPNSLSDNSVNYLYEDHHGQLWVCTSVGLNCIDIATGRLTSYFVKNGLPNDVIFGIQEDAHDHYWISTNNGLSMFDPVRGSFHNFSEADGLQSNEFKAHACAAAADGALFFGGVQGFNEFYPDSIKVERSEPPLVITRFMIFNKDVPIKDTATADFPLTKDITDTRDLTLSYRSSVFTFEFASLDYTLKAKKHYAYLLEGFDEKWNFIGSKRTATYTNLNPGSYTFRVRALSEDGSWLPGEASMRLVITPPFWRTWWFFILVAVSAVVVIWLGLRLRVEAIHRQKRVLEKQVRERTMALNQKISEERLVRVEAEKARAESERARMIAEKAQKEAEKADRAKSDFLANMSHELRTPMNAIIGFSDLALTSTLYEPERGYIQNVQRAGHNLLSIINDILDYSKIEAGKLIIDNIAFNPSKLIQETADILAMKAFEKGLELICDIDPQLPVPVIGDPVRWRQILINLLGNAIKFTEKGEIVVVAKKIPLPEHTFVSTPIALDPGADHVPEVLSITVRDTGIGIPREKLSQIFERFTQADSSTTRTYGGTGLGLTIAKHLAEMMGGTLEVESAQGQGSKFTLLLPLEVVASRGEDDIPVPAAPELHQNPIHGRLLVVDDNQTNCELMAEILKYLNMEAVIVRSGQEALVAIAAAHGTGNPFDCVITDHQMPGMDGITLVREIKTRWQGYPQPFILMLSSLDRILHQAEAQHAGIDLFLSKPVKMQELDHTLCLILDKKTAPAATTATAAPTGLPTTPTPAEPSAPTSSPGMPAEPASSPATPEPSPSAAANPDRQGAPASVHTPAPPIVDLAGIPAATANGNGNGHSNDHSNGHPNGHSNDRITHEAPAAQSAAPEDPPAPPTTIIVAEDDPVNMLLITEVLSKMGCTVIKACNGKEAIERLQEEACASFILMDVNMPEMDGLEATRNIRELKGPKAGIPIIALTAGVMQKDKDRCYEAGMDDIITKPFRLEEIRAVLDQYSKPMAR